MMMAFTNNLVLTLFVNVYFVACMSRCPYKLEPIGCYADKESDRALPEQILNERDMTSYASNGFLIDWRHFEDYLPEFLCRCATAAVEKGYKVVGAQFFGECWSGPNAQLEFGKHGKSNKCYDGSYSRDVNDTTKCVKAVGYTETNYVYRIAPTECETNYQPIGCYKDTLTSPRPLPNYIMNERDYSISNWNGNLIDWTNWKTYSPKMICRCATLAKEKGHLTFGVQFWGECWSSASASGYERDGLSTDCSGDDFKTCPCNSYHCVGKAYSNYVYSL